MAAFALCLLCLALLQTSWCQFVFELKLDDIVDLNNCYDALEVIDPTCETYLAKFCLREARDTSTRSYDLDDCPFGRAGRFGHFSALPIIKPISSSQPWPGNFQLYIKARDEDSGNPDDDRDEIFIDMSLAVNQRYTSAVDITGDNRNVQLRMSFRVECWENHYGDDCSTFCEPRDDDMNGHYSCKNNGSLECLEGFENPSKNCTDVINTCASSPCTNNGSCISMGPFSYTCQFPPEYSGSLCEENVSANPEHTPANDTAASEADRSTITITILGVLLVVFCVGFLISTTALLLILRQRICNCPLSREGSQQASNRTKQESVAYIEDSMQPNFLYDSKTFAQLNHPNFNQHVYEPVVLAGGVINSEPNVLSAQNPVFHTSNSLSHLTEKKESDTPLPPRDARLEGNETKQGNVAVNAKEEKTDATTANVYMSYNRLQHGHNNTQPQTRLATIEGLGYDALEK